MATKITREALQATAKRRIKEITLSNGLTGRIQSLFEDELSAYEAIAYDEKGQFQTARLRLRRRKLIQLCLIDDNGNRLYAPKEVTEIKLDGGVAKELFALCLTHCGLDEAEKASGDIDTKKDNSDPIGDADSSSDLP